MEQSLTPQMLQSLKILQVPILDLQLMVRAEMDQNPTLERETPEVEQVTDFEEAARDELREEREIGELTELAEWDQDFRSNREVRSSSDEERHQFMMDSIVADLQAIAKGIRHRSLSKQSKDRLREALHNVLTQLEG